MRTSAFSIKSKTNRSLLREVPKEGTNLRKAYDRAMTGKWFHLYDFVSPKQSSGIIVQLRVRYELELITRVNTDSSRSNNSRDYKCVGLWDGVEFKSLEDVKVALDHTLKKDN